MLMFTAGWWRVRLVNKTIDSVSLSCDYMLNKVK